ncbi:MAG: ATP synthase F1 subunit epsilon [Bacilli bacterium]|nr:ATP synthase F1 subunit epsilon [Bacilli bacterium]
MKISVVTPQGELYKENIDYVVVTSKMNGEFAIMKDHIPIISTIDTGYIKIVREEKAIYTVVINGVVEFQDNTVNIIAQEAHVGMNKDSAMDHLNTVREERISENKRRNVDFAKAERELKKNVKDAKAGNL